MIRRIDCDQFDSRRRGVISCPRPSRSILVFVACLFFFMASARNAHGGIKRLPPPSLDDHVKQGMKTSERCGDSFEVKNLSPKAVTIVYLYIDRGEVVKEPFKLPGTRAVSIGPLFCPAGVAVGTKTRKSTVLIEPNISYEVFWSRDAGQYVVQKVTTPVVQGR